MGRCLESNSWISFLVPVETIQDGGLNDALVGTKEYRFLLEKSSCTFGRSLSRVVAILGLSVTIWPYLLLSASGFM